MVHVLQNKFLKIQVADFGAELKSITDIKDGTEYLHNGDPQYWKYTSPVLFPLVGKVVNNKYRVEGKEYELPQHGFARTSKFKCIRETEDELVFRLNWSEETLKVYPYKFSLQISYILRGNEVEVIWNVENFDDKEIYFSIGAHPALKCPIVEGENFDDCYLKFDVPEKSSRILLAKTGNLSHNKVPTIEGKVLNLNYDLFKGDALVFDDLKSDEISICSRKSSKSVTIRAEKFPYMGIWTPAKGGAPLLCIEPWLGHADYEDFTGDFSEKEGIHKLNEGESFDAGYTFIINE
jgi:galactose mutarotase-like enzyme